MGTKFKWTLIGIVTFAIGFGGMAYVMKIWAPIRFAESTLSNRFKDPDGVLFRNMSVRDHLVCGEFNARNGFGGYIGYQSFILNIRSGRLTLEGDETHYGTASISLPGCGIGYHMH